MNVHNHGTEDGPGIGCPERILPGGQLQGDCIALEVPNRRDEITGIVSWGRIPNYTETMPVLRNAIDWIARLEGELQSSANIERMARTLCKADYPLQEDFERYWELLSEAHYVPLAAKVIAELLNGTAGE